MFVASLFTSLNAHDMMSHSTHMEETSKKIDVKQTLVAKKGKKIFEEMCDKNQIKDFNSQDEAKDFLTKSSICKQIGNAVPVNLAYAVGRSLIRLLNGLESE